MPTLERPRSEWGDPEQRDAALLTANEKRAAIQKMRSDLKFGRVTVTEILLDPKRRQMLDKYPVWEVVGWQRGFGQARMVQLNRRAITEGVNLAVPISAMSLRTLTWLIANVQTGPSGVWPTRRRVPIAPDRIDSEPYRERYAQMLAGGHLSRQLAAAGGFSSPGHMVNAMTNPSGSVTKMTALRLCKALQMPVPASL